MPGTGMRAAASGAPALAAVVSRLRSGQQRDHVEFRIRTIRVGVEVTLACSAVTIAHVAAAAHQPHRLSIGAIAVIAVVDAAVVWRLPHRRLAQSGWLDKFVFVWSLAHLVAITAVVMLDGGLTSPFVAIFYISMVFAALTLPRGQLLIVVATAAAGLLLAGMTQASPNYARTATLIPFVFLIAVLCGAIAGELTTRTIAVEEAKEDTIRKLARAIEFRDRSTGGHVERMAAVARLLGTELGLGECDASLLFRASLMHDVGKIGVPDAILLKPGPLTPEERRIMERHAEAGYELLRDSNSELLQLGAEIALSHHERYDGRGYPHGLRGEEIPRSGRIVAVADVLDALTTDRVYRVAMSFEDALDLIVEGRGTQFDPAIVDALLARRDEAAMLLGLDRPALAAASVFAATV